MSIERDILEQPGDWQPEEDWRLKTSERLALVGNSWFSSLSPAVRHDLLRAMRVRTVGHGEDIFCAGESVRAWSVCVDGAVGVSTSFPSGRSLMLHVLRCGQWFGDLPVFGRSVQAHSARAIGGARIGELDTLHVLALANAHPEFHKSLHHWQSMRLESVFRLLEEQAMLHSSSRFARQLLRLARDHGVPAGGNEVRIALPLRQSDFASLTGCVRQRANEQIGELARRGIIRRQKGYYILADRDALAARADA